MSIIQALVPRMPVAGSTCNHVRKNLQCTFKVTNTRLLNKGVSKIFELIVVSKPAVSIARCMIMLCIICDFWSWHSDSVSI